MSTLSDLKQHAHWLVLLGFIGVTVAVIIGRPLFESSQEKPTTPLPPQIKLPPRPEEAAKPHLDTAELGLTFPPETDPGLLR